MAAIEINQCVECRRVEGADCGERIGHGDPQVERCDGAATSIGKDDVETIKLIVSVATGCDYCIAAHSLVGKLTGLSADAVRQLRQGQPTGDAKRDALATFVRNLATTSGNISDEQFAAIKAAGYTDQQLADISLSIATGIFTNMFNRINATDIDFPPMD